MTDTQIFAGYVRVRDRAAIGPLFDRYAPRVYTLALSVLRDPERAADVTQDVFVKLLESPPAEPPEQFRPWLYRAAWLRALQAARTERREQDKLRRAAEERSSPVAPADPDLQRRVRDEIDALDPALAQPVLLHYLHGLPYAEIARVLDRPEGTVASQLHDAREKLRVRLATALGVAISFESALASIPMTEVPASVRSGIAAHLARAAARPPTAAVAGAPKFAVLAAAVLLPAALVLLIGVAQARRRAAVPSHANARSTAAAAPVRPSPPSTPSGAGDVAGTTPLPIQPPAATGATLRIKLADAEPEVTSAVNLESIAESAILRAPAELESPDTWLIRVPCAARTLFGISTAPPKVDAQVIVDFLGWAVAGPGETVDVELQVPKDHFGHAPDPSDLLLRELERSRSFGAIRGRIVRTAGDPGREVTMKDRGDLRTIVFDLNGDRPFWRGNGEFLFIPLRPGATKVTIKDECCSEAREVEVRAGQVADLGDLTHIPRAAAAVIAAAVVDENGRPVAGVQINIDGPVSFGSSDRKYAITDKAGGFAFSLFDRAVENLPITVWCKDRPPHLAVVPRFDRNDLVIKLPKPVRFTLKLTPAGDRLPHSGDMKLECRVPPKRKGFLQPFVFLAGDARSFTVAVDPEVIAEGTEIRVATQHDKGFHAGASDWVELRDGMEVTMELKERR